MKNLVIIEALLLLIVMQVTTSAQDDNNLFHKGRWELNFTGSLGSIAESMDFSSEYGSYNSSDSHSYFELGIIPAYYLFDGLSIEPEINMMAFEGSQPAFLFLGNLSYTMKVKNSIVFPYVRAGYGVSNSFQFPVNRSLSKMSNSLDIGVLNLGGGIKVSLSEKVLLRTEVNYRSFSYSHDANSLYYNASSDYNVSSIALLFGFSILL
jgi:hypothetical protein